MSVISEAADIRYTSEEKRFSICTLVNDWDQYQKMLDTFEACGFRPPGTEFLHLDNSAGNRFDGFDGLRIFLSTARGRHIVLCHQDIRLIDSADILTARIAEIDAVDPHWGVLGNAGGVAPGILAIRISDPHGNDVRRGVLPEKVSALDENLLVVRRSAGLAVGGNLDGFHLYGTDLCIMADILGYSSYVIDFHVQHLSAGNADRRFHDLRRRIIAKYARAFRSRWAVSPSAAIFISSYRWLNEAMNTGFGRKLARRGSKGQKR